MYAIETISSGPPLLPPLHAGQGGSQVTLTGVSNWGEYAWVLFSLDVWSNSRSELHPSHLDDMTYRVYYVVLATQNSAAANGHTLIADRSCRIRILHINSKSA